MSHIVSFKVIGLAGRTEPLGAKLNRDTNVFFGLNGSGKTSLLKILHAAMANETDILGSVPFKKAQVKIYSLHWDKVFTRTIEKQERKNKGPKSRGIITHREVRISNEVVMVEEPTYKDVMEWTCIPATPKDAAKTSWVHKYLPTSRLHVSDEPILAHGEGYRSPRPWLTEEELDTVFARSVEHLWSRYSAEVLSAVRTAQEQGLASILRAVLSPQNERKKRQSKLTSSTAYDRVHTFLRRQGSASILGKKGDFEKRYDSDQTLQDVVKDIDSVEDKIKAAMTSRNNLQELIQRLFMANKRIKFSDESIKVTSQSGENIGLASLSSGEKHLLRILVETLLVRESSLMIDEPEISMHIDWQKDLIRSLRSLNQTAQFIFATHSPEIMADVPDENISEFEVEAKMERLHHSYAGHLRLMQMSTTKLYVFVEGKQCDPYFFAQVCNNTLSSGITYEISTARQLPGNSGGKQTLLKFFTYLRTKRSLVSSLGGQQTACIFFLDKDVDDLQRRKKRSPHVVYTKYYDVQNYVFENGDLVKGSAAAASVDPRRLEGDIGDSSRWCKQVAILWKDWIALCLRLIEDGVSGEANYKVLSPVQTRLCGPTDQEALDLLTRKIAYRAGLPVAQLRNRFMMSLNKVDKYLQREDHHRLYKGKWFGSVLADDIDRLMAGDPYDKNTLSKRLPSSIAATLDFSQPWINDFRRPLQNIATMLS